MNDYHFENTFCNNCPHKYYLKNIHGEFYVCKISEAYIRDSTEKDYIIIDIPFRSKYGINDIVDHTDNVLKKLKHVLSLDKDSYDRNISMFNLLCNCPNNKKLILLSQLRKL